MRDADLGWRAPCQQIDSEEDDDQEAEAEDEVSRVHITHDFQAVGTSKRSQQAAALYPVFCDACVCVCVALVLWSCTYQCFNIKLYFNTYRMCLNTSMCLNI